MLLQLSKGSHPLTPNALLWAPHLKRIDLPLDAQVWKYGERYVAHRTKVAALVGPSDTGVAEVMTAAGDLGFTQYAQAD